MPVELPGVAKERQEPKNKVQLLVSRSVRWTFDVDYEKLQQKRIEALKSVRSYCSELRHLR